MSQPSPAGDDRVSLRSYLRAARLRPSYADAVPAAAATFLLLTSLAWLFRLPYFLLKWWWEEWRRQPR
jgi:hypothetical protein